MWVFPRRHLHATTHTVPIATETRVRAIKTIIIATIIVDNGGSLEPAAAVTLIIEHKKSIIVMATML